MEDVRQGLAGIGYTDSLLHENYDFALLNPEDLARTGSVSLAAFGATPPSYRNACMGVVSANGQSGESLVSHCRDLGAPQILEIHSDSLHRWGFDGLGEPRHLERVRRNDVPKLFNRHRAAWAPQSILRAKASYGNEQETRQLDFYDAGFFPLIESLVKEKLDSLLRDTLNATAKSYKASKKKDIDAQELFRLVFRFLAGKILVDRGALSPNQTGNPNDTLHAVDAYYNMAADGICPTRVRDADTLAAAWESIQSGLDFRNLSADDLAFVYENTLVSADARKQLGTHATPPSVAEYIVRKLPFEDLEQEKRRVLEPCSGHGVFLLSAMRRLRELLPPDTTDAQRHRYLKTRLVGIEIDSFAVEVARLSLMLADYPNKNDWKLHNEDVFSGHRLRTELMKSDCVLCNPPYEDFPVKTRSNYDLESVHKPIEILGRVLRYAPTILGFVLPISFLSRPAARFHQRELAAKYSEIEMVTLPDRVFSHSDSETVLLMAWNRKRSGRAVRITCRDVVTEECDQFIRVGKEPPGRTATAEIPEDESLDFSIWTSRLSGVWRYLSDYPTLGKYVTIHRGVEYNVPVSETGEGDKIQTFSRTEKEGFRPGLFAANTLQQYCLRKHHYLRIDVDIMRGGAHKYKWDEPKLLCNAVRISRSPWRVVAVFDRDGLYASQGFHGLWPNSHGDAHWLMAVLNSPVANAFLFDFEQGRHNKIVNLKNIPVPNMQSAQRQSIGIAVQRLLWKATSRKTKLERQEEELRRLLFEIDAELLRAYDLPPRLERELLDTFQSYPRPVPGSSFTGYYPEGFKACFPLHEVISDEFENARAENVLRRLTPVNDPVVHEMLASVEDGDE